MKLAQRDKLIVNMYLHGLEAREIAQHFKLSRARVWQILTLHRVPRHYPLRGGAQHKNWTNIQCPVCKKVFSVSPSVRRVFCSLDCFKAVQSFKPAVKSKMYYEMRVGGMTWQAIADSVGCKARQSIFSAAKKYALKRNLPWPPEPTTESE